MKRKGDVEAEHRPVYPPGSWQRTFPNQPPSRSRRRDFRRSPPAQRAWVAERREELKSAIDEGIESGEKNGYVAFDVERIVGLIRARRAGKAAKRSKRG